MASTVAVRTQAARDGHRATRDVRRMRKAQALREGTATPTSQGRRRLKPNAGGARLHCARGASRPRGRVLRLRYRPRLDQRSDGGSGHWSAERSSGHGGARSHCRPRGLPCTLGDGPVCGSRKRQSRPPAISSPAGWVSEVQDRTGKRTASLSRDQGLGVVAFPSRPQVAR